MGEVFGLIGMAGFVSCIVWLIVLAAKRQKKKVCIICMAASVALFATGIATSPDDVPTATSSQSSKISSNSSSISSSCGSNCTSSDLGDEQAPETTQEDADSSQFSESDGRISKEAYGKIKNGMTYDEVKSIVGSEGKNIFESGDKGTDGYSISYMWLGENGGEATIGFTGKNKLTVLMKSQSRLE